MKKKKIIIGIFVLIMLILLAPNVNAVYQMSPNKAVVRTLLDEFMYKTRQMEANGQVMGLKESGTNIKLGGTLLASSSSNKIDVHMTKNTEYGACIILSASQKYGKQGEGEDSYIHQSTSTGIATTTGNKYGVYIGNNFEFTAGGGKNSYNSKSVPYNSRYYDIYDPLEEKAGDATTSTARWKGSRFVTFVYADGAFMRGGNGAFSFLNDYCSNPNCVGRASAVCGAGF